MVEVVDAMRAVWPAELPLLVEFQPQIGRREVGTLSSPSPWPKC